MQVELMTGPCVLGMRAWSLGAHTGVIFHEPLQPSHPLWNLNAAPRRALRWHRNTPLPEIACHPPVIEGRQHRARVGL
jgi:hypothetical protein